MSSDPVLKTAIARYTGLRIRRQPLAETLLGFICSSAKPISQIKQCLENLARSFGTPLTPESHALPTWKQLATVSESVLRAQPASAGYEKELIADRPSSMLPYVVPAMDSRQQAHVRDFVAQLRFVSNPNDLHPDSTCILAKMA